MARHSRQGHKGEGGKAHDSLALGAPAPAPAQTPLDAAIAAVRAGQKPWPRPFDLPDPWGSLDTAFREALPADVQKALQAPMRAARAKHEAKLAAMFPSWAAGRTLDPRTPPETASVTSLIPPREAGRVPSVSEAGGVLCEQTPPGSLPQRVEDARKRAYGGSPPSPEGEGEEKAPQGKPPVERPWIPAAVRAQMGNIDPHVFKVERIIEESWPDERFSYQPALPERANTRPPRDDEAERTDAHGWRIIG